MVRLGLPLCPLFSLSGSESVLLLMPLCAACTTRKGALGMPAGLPLCPLFLLSGSQSVMFLMPGLTVLAKPVEI